MSERYLRPLPEHGPKELWPRRDGEVPETAPPHVPPSPRSPPGAHSMAGRDSGSLSPWPDVRFLPRISWRCPWGGGWVIRLSDPHLLSGHPVDPGGVFRQQHHLQPD